MDNKQLITTDELMRRLAKAVGPGGDFPVSARVVKELMDMSESPTTTASDVSNVVKRDPTLSARLISIVNSSFYGRSQPINNLTQGIIQLGMRPLVKIVGSLILLQKFVPLARQEGPFAHALSTSVLAALLHDQIHFVKAADEKRQSQGDPLLGMLSCIGPLLFSYYYPEIYDSARQRSRERQISISQSLMALSGTTSLKMSIHVLSNLHLAKYYGQILERTEEMVLDWSFDQYQSSPINDEAKILGVCLELAELLHSDLGRNRFISSASELSRKLAIKDELFSLAITSLPLRFKEYCSNIELVLPPLPEYLADYDSLVPIALDVDERSPELVKYLNEIREAISSGETLISIIGSAMEGLKNAIGFDRVYLLTPNNTVSYLEGRLAIGETGDIDIRTIKRLLNNQDTSQLISYSPYPETTAFIRKEIELRGTPIISGSWPIAAFPIGYTDRPYGVIYAEMDASEKNELTEQEIAIINIFAELLDKAAESQRGIL